MFAVSVRRRRLTSRLEGRTIRRRLRTVNPSSSTGAVSASPSRRSKTWIWASLPLAPSLSTDCLLPLEPKQPDRGFTDAIRRPPTSPTPEPTASPTRSPRPSICDARPRGRGTPAPIHPLRSGRQVACGRPALGSVWLSGHRRGILTVGGFIGLRRHPSESTDLPDRKCAPLGHISSRQTFLVDQCLERSAGAEGSAGFVCH